MEDIRPKGAWYAVYLNTPEHYKSPVVDVHKLAEILPHGSGIDGSWTIEVKSNGNVTVHGEYHAMDEYGGYAGWYDFRFTLTRCVKNEYVKLSGPCEGKYQVTRKKGTVYLRSFMGGGGRDNADYLYTSIWPPIHDELGISAISSDVVDSLDKAKTLAA